MVNETDFASQFTRRVTKGSSWFCTLAINIDLEVAAHMTAFSFSLNDHQLLPSCDINVIKRLLGQVNHMLSIQEKQLHNTIHETHQAVHLIMSQILSFEKVVKNIIPQFSQVHGKMGSLIDKNLSENLENYADKRKDQSQWQHEKVEKILQEAYQMISGVQQIESIAKRTKFIALNAHIESAHAGSYGTCFSIIATEIRDLSSQSEDVTKVIFKSLDSIKQHFHDFSYEQDKNFREEKQYLSDMVVDSEAFQKEFEELSAPSIEIAEQMKSAEKDLNEITNNIYLAVQFQDVTRQQIEHIIENLALCQNSINDLIAYIDNPEDTELKEIDTESVMKKYTMQSERDIFSDDATEMPPPVELF